MPWAMRRRGRCSCPSYLNNVDLGPKELVLYTDEAKRLLRAVLADPRAGQ